MRVLPVMDLMSGQAVHARAGQRDAYAPLQSIWTENASDPQTLTASMRDTFGITEWYVADLDALEGSAPQHDLILSMTIAGLRLWLDAGTRHAGAYLQAGIHRLVIASESFPDASLLHPLTYMFDPTKFVFSVDLHNGQVRTQPGAFPDSTPLAVAETAIAAGIRQLIILDTAAVGMSQGPITTPLCQTLRKLHPQLTIISGGGIRHTGDLKALEDAGVDIALVATALHTKREFAETIFSSTAGVQRNG
jgi:phosphoribosylformimino-5-aminoimidazole carboxamide ribotide isomerase